MSLVMQQQLHTSQSHSRPRKIQSLQERTCQQKFGRSHHLSLYAGARKPQTCDWSSNNVKPRRLDQTRRKLCLLHATRRREGISEEPARQHQVDCSRADLKSQASLICFPQMSLPTWKFRVPRLHRSASFPSTRHEDLNPKFSQRTSCRRDTDRPPTVTTYFLPTTVPHYNQVHAGRDW